jgi:hypothetical protein
LRTPVGFIVFHRPELTDRVFAEIAKARPPKLLVAADAPRADRPGEAEDCRAVRAIVERVDWPCEVLTDYAKQHLGCGLRESSAMDWFFEQAEEVIILEDDTLPNQSFFRFCEELLERYRDDERVMAIGGNNFLGNRGVSPYSYYFSRYVMSWGWASWRRAWRYYDYEIKLWPALRKTGWLNSIFDDRRASTYWADIFDRVPDHDTWDYQFLFACWTQHGLSIVPDVNLVSNIGYGVKAAHTHQHGPLAGVPAMDTSFPLRHPPYMVRNADADASADQELFLGAASGSSLYRRLRRRLAGASSNARLKRLLATR